MHLVLRLRGGGDNRAQVMLVKKGSDKIDEMKLEFRKTLIEAKKDIATKLGLEANKFHIT